MNAQEIASFVVSRWVLDHAPAAIMLQLICKGYPAKKQDVLAIIRCYVERHTENITYRGHR